MEMKEFYDMKKNGREKIILVTSSDLKPVF
jgi:hypothetical protein